MIDFRNAILVLTITYHLLIVIIGIREHKEYNFKLSKLSFSDKIAEKYSTAAKLEPYIRYLPITKTLLGVYWFSLIFSLLLNSPN